MPTDKVHVYEDYRVKIERGENLYLVEDKRLPKRHGRTDHRIFTLTKTDVMHELCVTHDFFPRDSNNARKVVSGIVGLKGVCEREQKVIEQ